MFAEHSNPRTRMLHPGWHFSRLGCLAYFIPQDGGGCFLSPDSGYGMAWIGHFFIEKNKPATFSIRSGRSWATTNDLDDVDCRMEAEGNVPSGALPLKVEGRREFSFIISHSHLPLIPS